MKRLIHLIAALVLIPGVLHGAPPNFVLIFIDDMGYGDIGPYGSEVNRTPNLDRMAAEGRKLTSFYAAPVCSASRAQLMTGSYAPRVSVPGVFFPKGAEGLNPAEHTVAEYLRDLGYATMCVGKWHLGDQVEFLPTRQGFDGYLGIPYSNDMGRVSSETGTRVHPLVRDEKVAELLDDEGQRRVTREYYYRGTNLEAVRSGPWKLALGPQSLGMGIKEKPEDLNAPGVRLYNLDEEIGELTNVADENPEVVARLRKLADGMIADIGSGKPGPGVRPAGVVRNPVMLYPTQVRKKK